MRLWSEQPSGGRGEEMYASLTLEYSKSMVLFFLVLQSTS